MLRARSVGAVTSRSQRAQHDVSGSEQPSGPEQVNVLGIGLSAITMADALAWIDHWIARRANQYICVTGVHGVMESQLDPALRVIHNRAGLVTPDGMPLVWISRLRGHRGVERVYGPDLMLACCESSVAKGYRRLLLAEPPAFQSGSLSGCKSGFPGCRLPDSGRHRFASSRRLKKRN